MTDFINYPARTKIKMVESTKKVVDQFIENPEELSEEELVQQINESKKAVAKKTKKGIRVKQVLNG